MIFFNRIGRREMLAENSLDWSIGEALAFGTLLKEGFHYYLTKFGILFLEDKQL